MELHEGELAVILALTTALDKKAQEDQKANAQRR
tara:strand:+ start:198 stop:299 length:102 start_codon:yes stop_codon:yes gene_type:complete